jgi:cbb3-type cytochrome oxidase subunit 3
MAFAFAHKPAALDDFRPFYRAAGLLGSPDLFAQTRYHADGLMFLRTPFYAALLQPLSRLDYAAAHAIWTALMAVCFAGFVWLWPGERPRIALAACWSVPVLMALALSQDIGLMLLVAAVALRLWQSERPLAAGLVASLLALKVTLLAPVALVFPARMPSFAAFSGGIPFAILAAAVYAWIWRIARRESIDAALTAALPLGIAAAPHCYAYDMAAAIPLFAAAAGLRSPRGILAALALSPAPYLLMSRDNPGPTGAALLVAAVLLSARMPRLRDATMTRTDGTPCPSSRSWFPRWTSARTSLL